MSANTTPAAAPKATKKDFPYTLVIVLAVMSAFVGFFVNERSRFDQRLFPNVDMTQRVIYESREGLNKGLEERLGANVQEILRQNPDEVFRVRTELDKHERRSEILEGVPNKSPQVGASYGSANLEEFRVIKSDPAAGEYEFQLDARQVWPKLEFRVRGGQKIVVKASGMTCFPSAPCVGPNGQDGLARYSRTRPEEFPAGNAMYQALIYRFDTDVPAQVGEYKEIVVPPGEHEFSLMDNIRLPEIVHASGGRIVVIRVAPYQP